MYALYFNFSYSWIICNRHAKKSSPIAILTLKKIYRLVLAKTTPTNHSGTHLNLNEGSSNKLFLWITENFPQILLAYFLM
jgi:hypothetical protein